MCLSGAWKGDPSYPFKEPLDILHGLTCLSSDLSLRQNSNIHMHWPLLQSGMVSNPLPTKLGELGGSVIAQRLGWETLQEEAARGACQIHIATDCLDVAESAAIITQPSMLLLWPRRQTIDRRTNGVTVICLA